MATGEGFAGWAKKAWREGKFVESADFYRRSAEVFDANGDFVRGAQAARHQAEALLKAGDAAGAAAEILAVLHFYRKREVPRLEMANALRVAALTQEAQGYPKEAAAFWSEAREGYLAERVEAGVAESDGRLAALGAD